MVNSSSGMSASIEIPGSVVCDEFDDFDALYEDGYFNHYDDDYFYEDYYYDDPCGNESNCTFGSGDYYYYYYDLTELFGNCSKLLSIPERGYILQPGCYNCD